MLTNLTSFWSKRCAPSAAFFIACLIAAPSARAENAHPEDRSKPAAPNEAPGDAEVVDLSRIQPRRNALPQEDEAAPAPGVEIPRKNKDNASEVFATVVELKKDSEPSTSVEKAPAKAASQSTGTRSFKEIMDLPDDQFDVAEAVLVLGSEKGFELSAGAAETLKRLDKIAQRAREQLPENPDVTDYYDALYDVVLNRRPSEAAHDEKAEDFDLSRAVFLQRGNCLSVGIAALAVARRLGAPINGAQCPGHFFLRGTGTAKGKAREIALNFDVTRPTPDNWTKLDDEFYRKWRHFDAKAEASGEYLRPMTDKQVVSAFLSSRSGLLAREGKFQEALDDAERALALNPKNIYALINGGFSRESLKKIDDAEADYRRALEIDPQCIRALNNLAFVKIRDKRAACYDPKRAEKLIDQALRINPDQAYLYATKGEICAVRGDYKAATHNLQVALSLSPKNAAYRERFMALREHLRRETPDEVPLIERLSGYGFKRDKNGASSKN